MESDKQASIYHIFRQEGTSGNKHVHSLIKTVTCSVVESEGNEIASIPLPGFPHRMFVAMSDEKIFQLYRWENIAEDDLRKKG